MIILYKNYNKPKKRAIYNYCTITILLRFAVIYNHDEIVQLTSIDSVSQTRVAPCVYNNRITCHVCKIMHFLFFQKLITKRLMLYIIKVDIGL